MLWASSGDALQSLWADRSELQSLEMKWFRERSRGRKFSFQQSYRRITPITCFVFDFFACGLSLLSRPIINGPRKEKLSSHMHCRCPSLVRHRCLALVDAITEEHLKISQNAFDPRSFREAINLIFRDCSENVSRTQDASSEWDESYYTLISHKFEMFIISARHSLLWTRFEDVVTFL